MVIDVPCPSVPVTSATVSQLEGFRGNEDRRVTFLSAVVPGADTCAPPAKRICPVPHDVVASRTVPGSGFAIVVLAEPRVIVTEAIEPAGPGFP